MSTYLLGLWLNNLISSLQLLYKVSLAVKMILKQRRPLRQIVNLIGGLIDFIIKISELTILLLITRIVILKWRVAINR